MDARFLSILLGGILAGGCFGPGSQSLESVSINDFEGVPYTVSLGTPDGALLIEIVNDANVSLFLRYSFAWSDVAFNPLNIVYLEEGGGVFIPQTLRSEYEPNRLEQDTYGRIEGMTIAAPIEQDETISVVEGAEFRFTSALRGQMIITWANIRPEGGNVTVYWPPGTQVRELWRSNDVEGGRFHEMGAKVGLAAPLVRSAVNSGITLGAEGAATFGVLKLAHDGTGAGEVRIRGEDVEQKTAIAPAPSGRATRYVFSSTGPTLIELDAANLGSFHFSALGASVPQGLLMDDVWYFQEEQY